MPILERRIPGVDATAKFVLLMTARAGGASGSWPPTTPGWAGALGISQPVAASALRQLGDAGCVALVVVPGGAKGRPRHVYRWQQSDLARLATFELSPGMADTYLALIDRLITGAMGARPKGKVDGRAPPSRAGAGEALSLPNRMVLATLLAYAGRDGVVRGRGTTELAALAGLPPSRFDNQIVKLLRLGFIRTYVAGASGAPLLGVVPGTYFLNLGHPEYGNCAFPSRAYALPTYSSMLEHHDRRDDDVQRLMGEAETAASRSGQPIEESVFATNFYGMPGLAPKVLARLAEILRQARNQGLRRNLQAIVEKHASYLLTDHRASARIAKMKLDQVHSGVLADIYPAKRQDRGLDENETQAAIKLLSFYLARRAIDMADHCQSLLRKFRYFDQMAKTDARQPAFFSILPWIPTTASDRLVVVVSFPPGPRDYEESLFLILLGYKYDKVTNQMRLAGNRESVRLAPFTERQYTYGLFTKVDNKKVDNKEQSVKRKNKG